MENSKITELPYNENMQRFLRKYALVYNFAEAYIENAKIRKCCMKELKEIESDVREMYNGFIKIILAEGEDDGR